MLSKRDAVPLAKPNELLIVLHHRPLQFRRTVTELMCRTGFGIDHHPAAHQPRRVELGQANDLNHFHFHIPDHQHVQGTEKVRQAEIKAEIGYRAMESPRINFEVLRPMVVNQV